MDAVLIPELGLDPAYEPQGWNVVAKLAREQNMLNNFEREERIAKYRHRLVRADWFYRYADRNQDFLDGQREFAGLLEDQVDLDPDGLIWREVSPERHASGLDLPQPRARRSA